MQRQITINLWQWDFLSWESLHHYWSLSRKMVTIVNNNCRLDAKQILKSLKPFRKPSVFLCLRRDQKGTLRRKGLKKVRKDLNSPMKMIQILSKKTTRIPSPKRMSYWLARNIVRLWSSFWKKIILSVYTNFEKIKNSFATGGYYNLLLEPVFTDINIKTSKMDFLFLKISCFGYITIVFKWFCTILILMLSIHLENKRSK